MRYQRSSDIQVTTIVEQPTLGTIVYGSTSGAIGTYTGQRALSSSITFYLENTEGEFVVGEQLQNQTGTVTYATIITAAANNIFTPIIQISDANVSENRWQIDQYGAGYVTFSEGTAQFDAYGRMQVSQLTPVGSYEHIGYDRPELYWTKVENGGSVTYDPSSSSAYYQIGVTVGAQARRTTNEYHPYRPGLSQLAMTTVICGDSGKVGLVREWGYFDDLNGFGFRQVNGALQVFLRSDAVTGSPAEEVVLQEDWNGARLIDPITDDFVLDVSKGNTFWMDMEWFGVGRVRLGVYRPDGRRITCHTFQNANIKEWPFMRTGSLPLTWNMYNTGVTGGSSEMRVTGAAVYTETTDQIYEGRVHHFTPAAPITVTDSASYVPLFSFRPQLTLSGKPNRTQIVAEMFECAVVGDSPIHIGIFKDPTSLTGASWSTSLVPNSVAELDVSATAVSQDGRLVQCFVVPGNGVIERQLGSKLEQAIRLNADGTQPTYVVAAKVLKPATSVQVFYTTSWKEIR